MKIVKMTSEHVSEVFDMMKGFYASPAVLEKASDVVLMQDINDCISPCPYIDGYVFLEETTLLGYGMVALGYSTEYGGVSLFIEDLFIKEPYRRQGIGTAFFQFLETAYPNVVRMRLEVERENEIAYVTYQNNQFHESPYVNMVKELKPHDR